MHLSKRSKVAIGAAALLFVASAASADDAPITFPECTKPPSAEDTEAAKQSHLIATSRFQLKDWDKAIEFWRQAYSLDCTAHAILVNIANAYEGKGDKRAAIAALETYLLRAKNAPDLVVVNERVLALKKSLEPAPTVTATATAAPTVTATAPAPTATATAAPTGARPYGSLPLIVAGVGGALAVAGVIMIPVGLGPYNTAEDKCKTTGCTADEAAAGNSGRTTWNAGAAFLGIGLVAAAGGLGWHFLFNKPASDTAAPATQQPQQPGGAPGAAPSGAPSAAPKAPVAAAPRGRLDVLPIASPQFGGLVLTGKF
jgi:tetratricopeptide (TPR) repeat protein